MLIAYSKTVPLEDFIPVEGQRRIAQAITEAERRTSGEICVHVTPHCLGETIPQAEAVFNAKKLYSTMRRNAVLIYIAYKDRKLAILGDEGINNLVPDGFWYDAVQVLTYHLKRHSPVEGICEAVTLIGEKLKDYFPADREDINEISNEVSYED